MNLNSDSVPHEDLLGRKEFAKKIATGLVSTTERETDGFVIGLTGKWGSGKSTLLSYVESELVHIFKTRNIEFSIIRFNPWALTDSEHIHRTFLKEFSSQLKSKTRRIAKGALLGLLKNLKLIGVANRAGGQISEQVGNLLIKYIDNNASLALKNKIDKLLIRANKKIFVFIDDIDRLSPKQIFEVFQVLKMTGNFKNTYYIIAYDREAVETSIETLFSNYSDKYLDKIIQADFLIPEVPGDKAEAIFFKELEALITDYQIKYKTSAFSSVWLHHGFRFYFPTLRDVHRYINSIQFSLPLIPDELDITDLLILEGIRLHDYKMYQKLYFDYTHSNFIIGFDGKFVSEEYLSKIENTTTRKLIEFLFPKNLMGNTGGSSTKRFYDRKNFEKYFTFQLSEKDIAEFEFKSFMEAKTGRIEIFFKILSLGRIKNLIIRLNDRDIHKFYSWDFSLIHDIYSFIHLSATNIEDDIHQISDAILNLLSARAKERPSNYNRFLDLLMLDNREVNYAKIYFMHFMLLSKEQETGFPGNEFYSFKEFYSERYEKLKTHYLQYLKEFEHYFVKHEISKPLSYFTNLFVFDFSKYLPEDYQNNLNNILNYEGNLIFFLKNILSISTFNEAYRINGSTLILYLPTHEYQKQFVHKLEHCDTSRLTEDQKKWREYALEYFQSSLNT